MAKELDSKFIEQLHTAVCKGHGITYTLVGLNFEDFEPYYKGGDFTEFIAPADLDYQLIWDNSFTLVLLILAAEEELEGYPMEAAQ